MNRSPSVPSAGMADAALQPSPYPARREAGSAWAPCPTPFNLAAHVLSTADLHPEKVALIEPGGEKWRYGALKSAVLGTAGGLLAKGLVPGDRVLLRLGNSVDFPIAFLGALAADLVAVPTSAQLTCEEVTAISRDLAPGLVLQDDAVPAPRIPAPPVCLDELRKMRDTPPASFRMGRPERPGYIIFTSGSTSHPRGVVHAHRAIWARGMMISGWEGLSETDRLLHAGAFNWTYTLGTGLLDPWSVGATALIPGDLHDPAELGPCIAEMKATIFAAVPGVYRKLLREGLPELPDLRHGLSAGEKLPDALRSAWRAHTGTDIHEAYGQSECSTFVSGSPATPAPAGRLGRPQPGRQVAILGDEGPLGPGIPGELAISSDDPGLMLGYLDGPDENARGAWRATGDLAVADADGWITYLGRGDDVMTAGGYRVSPLEVEAVATEVGGVEESAAFEREVRPGLRVIVLAYRGAPDREAAILARCAERLARYKHPRVIERHGDLPKNSNGKLQRRILREALS